MKKITKPSWLIVLALGAITAMLVGCKGDKKPHIVAKPLNISVYLDLSDRLLKGGVPDTKDRDLAIVDVVAELFRDSTVTPKILQSSNKMKVFFYPIPPDSMINTLADSLSIDIGKLKGTEKIAEANGLKDKLHRNLSKIYDLTLKDGNWIGSDIWGFFSDPTKLDVQCIDKDARNVIIILTDGFIYHKNNVRTEGRHGFTYISMTTLADKESYLIADRKGLDNIEVLMLEITPTGDDLALAKKTKMKDVLADWFTGMGVKHFQIVEADTKSNTKTVIEKFLDGN